MLAILANYRVVILVTLGLTVVFFCLRAYFMAGKAEQARKRWAAEQPPLPEETYVKDQQARFAPVLRRRLIWSVYVVPVTLLCVLIYVLNLPVEG